MSTSVLEDIVLLLVVLGPDHALLRLNILVSNIALDELAAISH
jgi:hypothetical protein